ncbi:hypothetical protein V5O48_004513 [Marasmius crinis-equi]|uniref:Uncharacterized protein n=1 Tax=Marasmius crinis-equi TaxID=585013 RepID=A0ABR3FPZ5_9AGAR
MLYYNKNYKDYTSLYAFDYYNSVYLVHTQHHDNHSAFHNLTSSYHYSDSVHLKLVYAYYDSNDYPGNDPNNHSYSYSYYYSYYHSRYYADDYPNNDSYHDPNNFAHNHHHHYAHNYDNDNADNNSYYHN